MAYLSVGEIVDERIARWVEGDNQIGHSGKPHPSQTGVGTHDDATDPDHQHR